MPILAELDAITYVHVSFTSGVSAAYSTGAGLTGVFLAVDYLLEAGERQGTVDVWSAVNSLRHHRPKMVPTLVIKYAQTHIRTCTHIIIIYTYTWTYTYIYTCTYTYT